jgi:solute carrier family 66, member 2
MIAVHLLLLQVALTHRPPINMHTPFSKSDSPRPYNFWQWRPARPYWSFLSYFTLALLVMHVLMSSTSVFIPYTSLLGYVALAIEATLPIPQLLANYRRRGCKGFRFSVIVNWLIGDAFKMWFFFASGSGEGGVPIAFKLCGLFQATSDVGLGLQFYFWGDGPEEAGILEKGVGVSSFHGHPVPETEAFAVPYELEEKPSGIDLPVNQWERSRMN